LGVGLDNLGDEFLITQAIAGNHEAFGLLYERYVHRIYNYLYYRTGNIHEAEDLTARVFMRAYRHIENYTDRGLPFTAWLYRIAHNLVANWYRDNSRRQEIILDERLFVQGKSEHPESEYLHSEAQALLMKIIRRLPPERQQLLILKFVEQMTNSEIGLVMGRTEGAIKSLYHRTLLALREELRTALSLESKTENLVLNDSVRKLRKSRC